MKTTTFIKLAIVAGMWASMVACSMSGNSVKKPQAEVKKVAYADKILLHMHPEKVLSYLPDLKDDQIAYLFGMTTEEYVAAKKEYSDQAKKVATRLLKDPAFAKKVDALPFGNNDVVLVLGESTADALNSWVYILGYLLEQRRPNDKIKVINGAISGQTTTEALKRITTQLRLNPNWILCHLGANDCMRYGSELNKTNVSVAEVLNNLRAIQSIVASESKAKLVWMAPAPVNEKRTSDFPPFKQMKLTLRNADLMAVADSMQAKFKNVIDFREEFGVPAEGKFMQFDGGHLTIDGQELLVSKLVTELVP